MMSQVIDGIELVSCPFCGYQSLSMENTKAMWLAIQCDECGAQGPCIEVERVKAIHRWNYRAKPEDDGEAE
jgi:Lar family restriction alleviation protein